MKFLTKCPDGGPDSGVTAYVLIEWKRLFSVVLLHFAPGSREAFHSHAFNAVTWWLRGGVEEQFQDGSQPKRWSASWRPKFTPRSTFHKVIAGLRGAWAVSFRGPWQKTWQEHKNGETYTLTSPGRQRL